MGKYRSDNEIGAHRKGRQNLFGPLFIGTLASPRACAKIGAKFRFPIRLKTMRMVASEDG